MDLGTSVIQKLHYFFRYKVPDEWIKVTYYTERRNIAIQSKSAKTYKEFNKDYNKKVLPYWKRYGIKPYKKAYKILCPEPEKMDPRYIPNDIYYRDIINHFNNIREYRNLPDKALQDLFVKELTLPKTIIKSLSGILYDSDFCPISLEEAANRCKSAGEIVVKESRASFGGKGVGFVDTKNMSVEEIIDVLKSEDGDFIAQGVIKQHKVMANINDSSINTIRLFTFYYKGKVHVLSAVLRMGSDGSRVDNITQGGFACKIHEDGRLDKYAVSRKSNWNTVHPSGVVFEDVVIPNYENIVAKVKLAATKIPFFKILGWDIAVNEDSEPVFIEYNIMPEQNQKTWGPTFGDLTDEVLAEVYLNKQ